ncbi:MAG TPA: 2-C-methyl-D-erythritol 4-phosphate cytidylyltransferase [Melioribacteraceae bacterium]|nr:2-C-methyl-D-erythritol 4-phosphate cytidylyltransferase [Melioribacteraceae bacterium]
MKTIAIIPSGGSGKRTGIDTPKQYIKIKDKEVIAYTLDVLQNCPKIDEIYIAAQPEYFDSLFEIKKKYNFNKVTNIVKGGKERQDSVYNALLSIPPVNSDILVAVHDAARPLLPQNILINAINDAENLGNAVVAIKAKDTLIKLSENSFDYLNRNEVYYVQTPQIFLYKHLIKAFKNAYNENFYGTDESMLIKRLGIKINITLGSTANFKLTDYDDILLFDKLT